jgi:hypothetical protein
MKKVLFIFLIFCFSLTIISCRDFSTEYTDDTTAPVIAEVTAVTTPTTDTSPNYTFSSDEAGTITYGGSCSSSTTSVTRNNQFDRCYFEHCTITLVSLSTGTYSDCTITVTDTAGNVSSTLTLSSFTVAESEQMGGSMQGGQLSLSTVVTTLAGTGSSGSANGTGTSASFYQPNGVTTDGTNLYVAESNNLIRQIVISTGVVTTVAGTGSAGSANGTGRTAIAIAAGDYNTCALLDNGSVKCWGSNGDGESGIDNATDIDIGDSSGEMALLPVVKLGTGRTATAISIGTDHICAVLDDASVRCWGSNDYGQLGIDNTNSMGDNSSEMALLTGINLGTGRTATAIAAGNSFTCAVLDDASVKCWGLNGRGQLGIDNTNSMGDNSSEMAVLPSINF